MKAIGRIAPTVGVVVIILIAWAAWHHYATHYLHPAHEAESKVVHQAERTKSRHQP